MTAPAGDAGTAHARGPAIRFDGISKRFGGITALSDVSFEIAAGSCHAICGENGAGKSTLGRILAGIESAGAGTMALDGVPFAPGAARDAFVAGIAMVHQELAFCANLSVAENLCLSFLPRRGAFVDREALTARAVEMLAATGAEIDPARTMESLSVAEQQLVQIAAAVGAGARVIIFDEPTSALGARETERLYDVIARLKAAGTTIIYVSHRMHEIFRLCDAVTVLRDGAHAATRPIGEVDEAALVELMIGRRLDQFFPPGIEGGPGEALLDVRGLRTSTGVRDVSFTVRRGEVVGLAGLVGAGRSQVAHALFGLDSTAAGDVTLAGARGIPASPNAAIARGVGLVPEDRKRHGLVLAMANRANASLAVLDRVATRGFIRAQDERGIVGRAFQRMRMSADPEAVTGTLSGGNQQKVVLARWLAARSAILILDEPTRGVDVGAKAEIHEWVAAAAAAGAAVLLISSDMPELLHLATRIVVMHDGRTVGELSRTDATQERALRMMSNLGASAA
jgi:ABC-type sugar transport system ATPase subunit